MSSKSNEATIVAGTVAERCQMNAYLLYSMMLTGFGKFIKGSGTETSMCLFSISGKINDRLIFLSLFDAT